MRNRPHLTLMDWRAWKDSWHRFWEQFLAEVKECHSLSRPSWQTQAEMLSIPHPWSRWKAANDSHSLSAARLFLQSSTSGHCGLHADQPGRPKPFHPIHLCSQIGRVMAWWKTWKYGIHNAQEVLAYWTRTGMYLIHLSVEKELCPSKYNFHWYLRHVELLRILVPPQKWQS